MNSELLTTEIQVFKSNKSRLLGRLLNKSYRYMRDLASEYLREMGYGTLRVGHIVALVNIDWEGSNINFLAQAAGMTKQAMSKIIKELQSEDYLVVEKDKNDARALIVKYTPKGLQALSDLNICMNRVNKRFGEILGEESFEQLKNILNTLVEDYENEYLPNQPNHVTLQNNLLLDK